MPKQWAMSQLKQISRPFQIMFVATVVLFALWLVVLRNHSSSGESSPSSASSSAQPASPAHASGSSSASSGASGSSAGSSAHHSSAPGVAGLTRAIAKARGAVAQSEHNARQLQHKQNQASGSGSGSAQTQTSGSHASSTASGAKPPVKTASTQSKTAASAAPKTQSSAVVTKTQSSAAAPSARAKAGIPAMQSKVEAQLKQGKLVAILLWNPQGSVDNVARRELQAARHTLGAKLAVHVARSSEVGSFGTFTRTVQVYSTPTILLINHKGATSSVTGLTDAFSIEQAVREAEQAS
jgi:hypothetical protein